MNAELWIELTLVMGMVSMLRREVTADWSGGIASCILTRIHTPSIQLAMNPQPSDERVLYSRLQ